MYVLKIFTANWKNSFVAIGKIGYNVTDIYAESPYYLDIAINLIIAELRRKKRGFPQEN